MTRIFRHLPTLRFAATGAVASAVDYVLYLLLTEGAGWTPVHANLLSYPTSVLVNFLLQRRYVFELKRATWAAFGLSMLVSAGGLLLSTGLVYTMNQIALFRGNQYVIKFIDKGLIFFYNYYFKRFAFEKRFVSQQ
jgi:putative flippase GtrA